MDMILRSFDMIKKIAFLPANKDVCVAARYYSLLEGYELVHIFTPESVKLDGKPINILDGGPAVPIFLSGYSEEKLLECDSLFVASSYKIEDQLFCKKIVDTAVNSGIEVFSSSLLSNNLGKNVKAVSYFSEQDMPVKSDRLYEVKVPVITVLSQGAYTNQFAVELALRKYFSNKGYKISQIGSNELSYFFGFESIPGFIFDQLDAYKKILKFNHYVRQMLEKEKPELMIIGVPDAIMKYNNRILQGAGVLPFIIGSSVKSDLSILCMYYNMYKKQYFEDISNFLNCRLDALVKYFNISNTTIGTTSGLADSLDYIGLDSEFVSNNIKSDIYTDGHFAFNVLDDNFSEKAFDLMYDDLTNNVFAL